MSSILLSLQDLEMGRRYYAEGLWQPYTMYQCLAEWTEKQPSAYALCDGVSRLTYAETLGWVDALAEDLADAGLHRGDRVAVWLSSRMESAIALLACSRMGFVCVPSLHRDHRVQDVAALLERCGAAALLVERGYGVDSDRQDIVPLANELPRMRRIHVIPPLAEVARGCEPRFGALQPGPRAALQQSACPDRIMYLAFTSGTMGQPKGVMHSDNTLLSNGRAIAKDFGFDEGTVVYTFSPMSHNMGTVSLVTALACGGELVLHGTLDTARALDRVIETGATYLVGVPTHAIDLLDELRERDGDGLGKAAVFQLAGSPVPTQLAEALIALGVTPQNTFGMTENCSFLYTRADDPVPVITASCGRCCDGMEAAVWDVEAPDRQVRDGETGELGVRGPSLMLGYFDDQSTTERSFNRQGWFLTGDLARIGPDGNVRIVGRKKDLIIRGGHNIHPARIEDLAMRHPDVVKAVAFPVADQRLGEKVCLAVVPRRAGAIDPDEILAHLDRLELSRYDMPEYFLELETLPLTASGKILKRELVAMVADGRLAPHPVRWRPKEAAART